MSKITVKDVSILLLGLVSLFSIAESGKILSISFFSSKSHKIVYEPLLMELANRGHSLTIVTPVKGSKPHKNIKEIIGIGYENDLADVQKIDIFALRIKKELMSPSQMMEMIDKACHSYLNMSEVQALKNEHFDLVFVSALFNECSYGLLPYIKAPYIMISPVSPIQWTAGLTGTPSPNSFVPMSFFGFKDKMTFFQRVGNMVGQLAFQALIEYVMYAPMEKTYKEYLGADTPPLYEIQKNVSLILSNSHMSLSHPRPFMPDIVEVGGMHCRPAQSLPKDLDEYLSSSGKDGFIYFSMGSVVKAKEMPEYYRKVFINAFSKLKQKVLWKWETEHMDDLPKNVKLSKWVPQQDVLGHPNIKMFITHGGMGSTTEAVYHGVPLIGLPMFGDQDTNMKQSENSGFALTLEFGDLTEETLLNAINQILDNPKYNERVKELSAVYRDRPQKPLDTAVYWSEYVMRHKGAVHLRSPARDLNWIQYHSVDVVAFVAAVISLALYLIYITLRCIFRKLCGSGKKISPSKKRS